MAETAPAIATMSKRSVNRLADLQHQLVQEMGLLVTQHSRLMGALMACDAVTQKNMMVEYRDQLHVVHSLLTKLCMVLDRYDESSNG